ncbi:hypothetical protein B0H14DRAFT_2569759 [Mycena olivaceomarginata]|nr:hypothetical protein B0H14DRAFT_2569759 [Mycena olivaceomarginata]
MPRAPLEERRALAPIEPYTSTRGRTRSPERQIKSLRRYSRSPSPRPRQRVRRRSPSPPRHWERRLPQGREFGLVTRRRTPSPHYSRGPHPPSWRRTPSPPYWRSPPREARREEQPRSGPLPDRRSSPIRSRYGSRNEGGESSLANRLTDPDAVSKVGRMAARTVWDSERRPTPMAPRADRMSTNRAPVTTPTTPLLQRLTDPKKPLLERLQPTHEVGKRALMERMDVGLRERVSGQRATTGHKRAHNRPKKTLREIASLGGGNAGRRERSAMDRRGNRLDH